MPFNALNRRRLATYKEYYARARAGTYSFISFHIISFHFISFHFIDFIDFI